MRATGRILSMSAPSIAHRPRGSEQQSWLESLVKLGSRLATESKTATPASVAGDLR
jgi:hypothetical protein